MWIYSQSTGKLSRKRSPSDIASLVELGYSGFGPGRNQPDFQCLEDVGPIPRGSYDILAPKAGPTAYSLPLSARPETDLCGRANFLLHGDKALEPPFQLGIASEGCIIVSRRTREEIWSSGDHILEVVRD